MLKTAIVGTFATVLLWTVFVPNAAAECGRMEKSKIVAFLGQEPSWQGVPKPAAESPISDTDPIVGFWKVKLMSKDNSGIPDGTVLDAGYSQWHSDSWGRGNYSYYKNEKVDDLIARARTSLDPRVRADLQAQAQRILVEDAVDVFTGIEKATYVWRANVRGYVHAPPRERNPLFGEMWLE